MLFRFRYQVLGGHTHVKLFNGEGVTLAFCGELCLRNEEWKMFMDIVGRPMPFGPDIQFVDDTPTEPPD